MLVANGLKKIKETKRRGKMKKNFIYALFSMIAVLASSPFALAATESAAQASAGTDYTKAIIIGTSLLVAGIAIAFGTLGTGLGMGNGLNGATNAVGRNPEAQGKILLTMMVGLAMIESLAIYALVIALIVLYANPLLKYLG
jgi:F-type H+-transporting ATPase subunit c